LAQPENPASFADSIDKLINDRSYARGLGQNGQRAFREKYSWETQIRDLANFYERILCPPGSSDRAAADANENFKGHAAWHRKSD